MLTEHPQGIAALVKIREHDLSSALIPQPALTIVAAAIQDPGNFGTLIRSAEAFGASAEVSYARGYPATVNSAREAQFAAQVGQQVVQAPAQQVALGVGLAVAVAGMVPGGGRFALSSFPTV